MAKNKKVDAYELSQKFMNDYESKIMKHAHFSFDASAVMAMSIVIADLVDALINTGNDEDVCYAIKRAKQFYNNTSK
jgi:hypothetical protein